MENNYFAKIPDEILFNKNLSDQSKLLYAFINKLSIKSGYCFAGNEYISEKMGRQKRKIQRYIKELRNKNIIIEEMIYNGNTNRFDVRKLSINKQNDINVTTPTTNMSPPHDINVTHNNIIYKKINKEKDNNGTSNDDVLKELLYYGIDIDCVNDYLNYGKGKRRRNLKTIANMCRYIRDISKELGIRPIYNKQTIGAINILREKKNLNGLDDFFDIFRDSIQEQMTEEEIDEIKDFRDIIRFGNKYLGNIMDDN